MTPSEIKNARKQLALSQTAFAELLGVSFATVNRWEQGRAAPQPDRLVKLKSLLEHSSHQSSKRDVKQPPPGPPQLDFMGNGDVVKLAIDACRLQNGHQFNKAFGLELSRVSPLPHQRIAVYEHMLPQNPLRFLLADDAGAGKTIMTGLYIREMVNRGRLQRAIICCPAGLTWNWRRELKHFFDLDFRILSSKDFVSGNPLSDESEGFFIVSVDTAAVESVRSKLEANSSAKFDLAVFDEAHKLSWGDPKRNDTKTRRYRLAETLSDRCTHLLLLTATPHMGKAFPYFALWRLLDRRVFSTMDALNASSPEKRQRYFIRRLKEEMVNYEGQPIYKPRLCQTVSFPLTKAEREFYDQASQYLRWSFENNRTLNKNAASMVVAVLQRRLASSTFAMLESLKRRRERILSNEGTELPSAERLLEIFDQSTADDSEPTSLGKESDENVEAQALSLSLPASATQRQAEMVYLDSIIEIGESILREQQESKFEKLRELVDSAQFQHERLLIFTEHRDTLEYLNQRFEALGYTGQIAAIHGGMPVEEREKQRIFFMPPDERRRQALPNPDASSARVMLATDAAGEGINLQFAWLMVNYDIPWNPARLEQRMGRLHRYGQRHDEVRIFNFVAENTREGDVLSTLLRKLDEARRELCSDKVFDVVGQQLEGVSIRDLLRDALFEKAPYTAQKQLESMLATQKLRAKVEEQRKQASSFGDVARRLGQLNSEVEVERFNQLLPAYIQNFIEKSAPCLGFELEGDLNDKARLVRRSESTWLNRLSSHLPKGLPTFLSVRRDTASAADTSFLRPGDSFFDALCQETITKFKTDTSRGALFSDPAAEKPYFAAVYVCQIGESSALTSKTHAQSPPLLERRMIGLRWDGSGEFASCAPNHLLALVSAPASLAWKAGALLQNPTDHVAGADAHARMLAETNFLQQARLVVRAECDSRLDDLQRGFDFRASDLAQQRSELSKKMREGDEAAIEQLELIKAEQTQLEEEKATALLYEQRRGDMLDIVQLERIAVALVVPDPSPEVREEYDRNIEAIAMRIAINYEVDHHRARVYDVSSPHLARGYDLESHRAEGEKIVIEVKGRAGRGVVHLTDNEWPTAANVREKYWLYVVTDCATEPRLYRVQDPVRLAFKTRQSFTLNLGDIIAAAEPD